MTNSTLPTPTTLEEALRVIAAQADHIHGLEAKLDELAERLAQNSRTSSKPPSQDGPKAAAERVKKKRSPRRKGAQPGHEGKARQRAREAELSEIKTHCPEACCPACQGSVVMESQPTRRHQVWEVVLPPPTITEHRFYAGRCQGCGRRHHAPWPPGVPRGQFGPTLLSLTGLLTGPYSLSLRQVQRCYHDLWGLSISVGALSSARWLIKDSLKTTHEQIATEVRSNHLVHADETWYRQYHRRYWGWVALGARHTYFRLHPSRAGYAAQQVVGPPAHPNSVLVTDQYGSYNYWPDEQRQQCWAHLARHWAGLAERPGFVGRLGQRLSLLQALVFRTHHRRQKGQLAPELYQRRMHRLRTQLHQALQYGTTLVHPRTRRRCQLWLKYEPQFWTFLRYPGVPLTNNTSEQALRALVYWRERHQSVHSHAGWLYLQRMLSLVATCRQQKRSVWDFLQRCVVAHLQGRPAPSIA